MTQSWQRQLFAHWPVDAHLLRKLVPPELELDDYHGDTYVGVTPFDLRGLRFHFLPPFPIGSNFLETNLRTYVRVGGKAGVFFFSLDAASRLAVVGARLGFRLPYFAAAMRMVEARQWISYSSERQAANAELGVQYRPNGPVFLAEPGSLDHFLTERYALYVVLGNRRVMRGDIHHLPWRLQPALADFEINTIPRAHHINLPASDPLLHYSARQDTLLWPLVDARD
jgi:uncharacterized protein